MNFLGSCHIDSDNESEFSVAKGLMFSDDEEILFKTCGGGKKGLVPYSAMWVYNILNSCNSINQLNRCKEKYYKKMHPTDLHYLQTLPDECQYPAARCAMGNGISMFSKSASLGVESMNKANSPMRQQTAVDILIAVMLLLNLEGE